MSRKKPKKSVTTQSLPRIQAVSQGQFSHLLPAFRPKLKIVPAGGSWQCWDHGKVEEEDTNKRKNGKFPLVSPDLILQSLALNKALYPLPLPDAELGLSSCLSAHQETLELPSTPALRKWTAVGQISGDYEKTSAHSAYPATPPLASK